MFWPTVLAHKIDADSPLWDMSARDLGANTNQFEVVLTFEGTTPETGNTVQVHSQSSVSQSFSSAHLIFQNFETMLFEAVESFALYLVSFLRKFSCSRFAHPTFLEKSSGATDSNTAAWLMIKPSTSMQSPTQPSTLLFLIELQGEKWKLLIFDGGHQFGIVCSKCLEMQVHQFPSLSQIILSFKPWESFSW